MFLLHFVLRSIIFFYLEILRIVHLSLSSSSPFRHHFPVWWHFSLLFFTGSTSYYSIVFLLLLLSSPGRSIDAYDEKECSDDRLGRIWRLQEDKLSLSSITSFPRLGDDDDDDLAGWMDELSTIAALATLRFHLPVCCSSNNRSKSRSCQIEIMAPPALNQRRLITTS